jgi:hypothetical protein
VAGCCECGDEPSGSCATELVSMIHTYVHTHTHTMCRLWSGVPDSNLATLSGSVVTSLSPSRQIPG